MMYDFGTLKQRYRKPELLIYFERENPVMPKSNVKLVVSNPKTIRLQDARGY